MEKSKKVSVFLRGEQYNTNGDHGEVRKMAAVVVKKLWDAQEYYCIICKKWLNQNTVGDLIEMKINNNSNNNKDFKKKFQGKSLKKIVKLQTPLVVVCFYPSPPD